MGKPDKKTLEIIRFLIEIVRPFRENAGAEWPEGYCAETSALIKDNIGAVMNGYNTVQCGAIPNPCHRSGKNNHIWSRIDGMNIDFTAHQFTSLAPHTVKIDGFDVLFGSDDEFKRLGYIFYLPCQCEAVLTESSIINSMNGW